MHPRAFELIQALRLVPHPEGGYYHEIHRSTGLVDPLDGRRSRAALTVIYFLLAAGEVSRLHRVRSDEVWHHLEGDPLELYIADRAFEDTTTSTVGPYCNTAAPVCVVPAGSWQAARSTGAYSLVACSVAPGFDFDDFVMLRDLPSDIELLETKQPALVHFV